MQNTSFVCMHDCVHVYKLNFCTRNGRFKLHFSNLGIEFLLIFVYWKVRGIFEELFTSYHAFSYSLHVCIHLDHSIFIA